jgi:hypothetical protein
MITSLLARIWISSFADDWLSCSWGPTLDFKLRWLVDWPLTLSLGPNSCSCDDDSDWPLSVSLKSLGPKFGFQVWWLDWLTLFHSLGPNLELQVLMIESLSLGSNLEIQILMIDSLSSLLARLCRRVVLLQVWMIDGLSFSWPDFKIPSFNGWSLITLIN